MKKKIISAVLALVLCLALTVSASAESKTIAFVIDELDCLSAQELDQLNELALSVYRETGVGIFFVFTRTETLTDYDLDALLGGISDYVVMMENETNWITFYGGKGETIDAAAEEYLRGVYDETATYVEGVEAFLKAAAARFPAAEAPRQTTPLPEDETLVMDGADLLSDSEEAALAKKLESISHQYEAQIVVATVASVNGMDVNDYLENTYDSLKMGYGEDRNGVLLLVCMDPREYRILSNGFAGEAITVDDIASIGDVIKPDLSDGDYAEAFAGFADECVYYLDGYINGFPFDFGGNLVICLLIGIAVGVIVALILKGQLKTVRAQNQANVYVKQGSMQLTVCNDMFLYRNVTRTQRQSSSSSGSSGSSGSSRSIGGGSF